MEEVSESQAHRSYAIIGTGAIGGFYGAKLQQAGFDVHFLLHSDRDYVETHGLTIDSVEGDFKLDRVNAYGDARQMPKCDVVVVALKTTRNHLLRQILPPVMKDSGAVLLLQNGLGSEELVAEIAGSDRAILGGLCFICSNKIGPGHIHHLDYGTITLGEYEPNYHTCGITHRMRQIGSDFERAGIPIVFAEDLLAARWKKLVWNIPYNGLSVVLDARTDEIMANESTRLLSEQLMWEVVAGAAALGREIPESFIQKMLDHTANMNPYLTSMKLDYDNNRPLEVEAILGNPLRAAIAKGVNLPKIEMLYHQLKFMDVNR